MHRRLWHICWVLLFAVSGLCFAARAARAQAELLREFREAPVVSVLTFGPGDAAFLKFGHNAIRVQDKKRNTDLVYNFGTFQFDSPTLILDFLTGKFRYWLSVSTFQNTLASYRRGNRSIVEQTLNIAPWTAREINEGLLTNALPENRYYLYDYYRDNCSTRIRDLLDRALKGELQKRFRGQTRMTMRDHTLRTVADDFWLYLGLDIAMGPNIDQKETRYAEMFLPEKLQEGLGSVIFSGAHGTQPLISETKTWHEASGRARLLSKPPERTKGFLQTGALIGAALVFTGWEAYKRRKRWAQLALPLILSVLGLSAGVLGSLFLGLWLFTNHEVAYRNENLLQCPPWALLLPVCAVGIYRARLYWVRLALRAAAACLAASLAGLLAKLLPSFGQHNERIIALFLPIWLGVFISLYWMQFRALRLARIETPSLLENTDPETSETPEEPPPTDSPAEPDPQDDEEEKKHPSTIPPEPAPA